MRSRYRIVDSDGIYFLTSTVVEWLPVFTTPRFFEVIVDALAYCRESKSLKIYAYVIMENHVHLVAEAPNLEGVLRDFKRHTAKRIVEVAESTGRDWLLNQFEFFKKGHKRESRHQIWQEGSHPQLIQDDSVLRQKIEYIHANPVRRGWVDLSEHWRFSSARNYILDDHSVSEIDRLPF